MGIYDFRMDPFTTAIAAAIRADMEEAGLTTASLARRTGIPRVTLQRRLAGSPIPTDELLAIGRVLHHLPSRWLAAAERRAS